MRLLASGPARSGGIRGISASYLSRVAYNAVVDEMRRRFRRAEVPAGDSGLLDDHPRGSAGPEDRLCAAEIHEALGMCLGAMRRPRRIAVACHLQGYSVPEAATFAGWSKKKTEHLVRRGMDDLRRCLTEKGLEP
jgi:RNA polymerase sigma-70 factor (ECF subfamily)